MFELDSTIKTSKNKKNMENRKHQISRRNVLKTSAIVFLGLSLPNLLPANNKIIGFDKPIEDDDIPTHFPNIDPEIISEVVGKSHFNLDRVKELVDTRHELAKASWQWRFGDFESAIGAASHVGRRDIALYLISKGASPSIFTYAMLGEFDIIKSVINANPGIQKNTGPHGISLLDHAFAGERMKDKMTIKELDNVKRTIAYLESVGNAGGEDYLNVPPEEQTKYLGDYHYGTNEKTGFSIQLNMRKMLSLGPLGEFGGSLYKIGENKFTYNGAPSVIITFDIQNEQVKSLTLSEPGLSIVAKKIS